MGLEEGVLYAGLVVVQVLLYLGHPFFKPCQMLYDMELAV